MKKPPPPFASSSSFTPICARLFCAIWPTWRVVSRVVEHVADDQLAAVLLAELAVESPAERVEFLFGLLRVEGHDGAVVLVALLAGDEDVVVQRNRIVGQPALGDVGDGLPVDALGDRQPQRLVRQDRTLRAVEREVVPARAGRAPDRDARWCSARSSTRPARPARWRRWCCSAAPGCARRRRAPDR